MKAVRLKRPGLVQIDEIERPEPGEGEVLLRVLAAGVCRTDCHIRAHPFATSANTTLGHEIAGEITAIGPGVVGWSTGQRAVVHPCWACHKCSQCRAGRENYCQGHGMQRFPPPTPGVTCNGGMAEFAIAPANSLVEIGDLDPAFAAVLADAGLAPYHSVRLLRDRVGPGSTALVIGLGGLGQFAVQLLKLCTPARVVAVAAPFGAIQAVGLTGGHIPFEAADMSTIGLPWGVTLMKPYSGSYRDLADVIALARQGKLSANLEHFPLEKAITAIDRLESGHINGRAVLLPNSK